MPSATLSALKSSFTAFFMIAPSAMFSLPLNCHRGLRAKRVSPIAGFVSAQARGRSVSRAIAPPAAQKICAWPPRPYTRDSMRSDSSSRSHSSCADTFAISASQYATWSAPMPRGPISARQLVKTTSTPCSRQVGVCASAPGRRVGGGNRQHAHAAGLHVRSDQTRGSDREFDVPAQHRRERFAARIEDGDPEAFRIGADALADQADRDVIGIAERGGERHADRRRIALQALEQVAPGFERRVGARPRTRCARARATRSA